MIVLDNLKIRLSVRMLSLLAEYNVSVVLCDRKHLPIGFYSSYDNHSRISKYIGYQIKAEQQTYDEIWRQIVEHKLKNQASVPEDFRKKSFSCRSYSGICYECTSWRSS